MEQPNLMQQITEYLEERKRNRITRSRSRVDHVKELIDYQRTLLKAFCTAQDLMYLINDNGECFNKFLESSLEEFKIVNWEHQDIVLYNKFKNHSVGVDDIITHYETKEDRLEYKANSLQSFKTVGWTIGSTWIDELFNQEEFIVQFNRAAKIELATNLEYLILRDRTGHEIAEYVRHCSLF